MRKLTVFNHVTLDGYFVDPQGDMSWAHNLGPDPEYQKFVAENASGEGELLFGRVTYDLMTRYWPTPMAHKNDPVVAEGMNRMRKVVFSRTLENPSWNNTRLVKTDPSAEVRQMKNEDGPPMVILGSGSIVSQLARQGLIDEYQIVLNAIAIGKGRTLFEGVRDRLKLKLGKTRAFGNGNVFLSYQPL
jgi:dihydrofolate reductase